MYFYLYIILNKIKMNIEDEPIIDYSGIDFDFSSPEPVEEEKEEKEEEEPVDQYLPPAYIIKNSVAKHKHLCQILAVYFHAKHGEPMNDIFDHLSDTTFISTHNQSLIFHLEQQEK